jgi:hypothetical protein
MISRVSVGCIKEEGKITCKRRPFASLRVMRIFICLRLFSFRFLAECADCGVVEKPDKPIADE